MKENERYSERFSIQLPPDLRAALESEAKDFGQSLAGMVRLILRQRYDEQFRQTLAVRMAGSADN